MDDTNNINKFLDKSFENALLEKPGKDFTSNLMREIELAKEFQREDKKTFKYLNIIIFGFISAMITSGIMLITLLGGQSGEDDTAGVGFFSTVNDILDAFSRKLFSLIGISLSGDVFLYLGGLVAAVILYSLLDRVVLKRSYN